MEVLLNKPLQFLEDIALDASDCGYSDSDNDEINNVFAAVGNIYLI